MMEDQIASEEVKNRSGLMTTLSRRIQNEANSRWIGWRGKVILDERVRGAVIGRNYAYKPCLIKEADFSYHDYTETRPGVNGYANVVRTGSVASHPSATNLDTGETLAVREMLGAELTASKLNVGEPVPADAHVVVIPFAAVKPGQSLRLRIAETYTAPVSYRLTGDELVFDRSLGRPRNAVVLPAGWYCTASAAPATVSQLPDGRVRLDYWDDRPEAVDVLLKARRRAAAP
jgi:hypothetical protein